MHRGKGYTIIGIGSSVDYGSSIPVIRGDPGFPSSPR
jgi:hypothetical protein